MTHGDSLARGMATRLIREENERILRNVLGRPILSHPTKPGRWYKATIRDMRSRLGPAIVADYEIGTGRKAFHQFVVLDLSEGFLGFHAIRVSRKEGKVDVKELPIALTLHLIQRLLQDDMERTVRGLANRVRGMFVEAAKFMATEDVRPGHEVTFLSPNGMVGAVIAEDGTMVLRTWVPRDAIADDRYERMMKNAKGFVHNPDEP